MSDSENLNGAKNSIACKTLGKVVVSSFSFSAHINHYRRVSVLVLRAKRLRHLTEINQEINGT